jgi:homopolymeric O-antigen transport system ATP-binding protein
MKAAVKFDNVYKEYPYYRHITASFKSFIFQLRKSVAILKKERFVALRDVSFEIARGETFGFIGRNGAGKSTVLGLIAGVIRQDRGRVATCGKISSLLELGAGFHPDLSGVENIILNGVLMGNTKKDMLDRMDEIIDFSELGEFVYQPLRTYSSGMQIRLGFSIAVNTNPEILLVDEALAVGDIGFQEKCVKKMLQFKEEGATIILVSHDMGSIAKLCDRALWMASGSLESIGAAKEVAMEYLSSLGEQRIVHGKDAVEDYAGSGEPACESTVAVLAVTDEESSIKAAEEEREEDAADVTEGDETDERVQGQAYSNNEGQCQLIPESLSWWDSGPIIMECASRITGSTDYAFYEFLPKQYMIGALDKGLSICCRLGGIETGFVLSNICKTFDVVDDERTVERMIAGSWKRKAAPYDFFLCIDFLHRLENPRSVMRTIAAALKEKAVMVAIEYVGPRGYARSEKEMKISDAIIALTGAPVRRGYAPAGCHAPFGSRRLAEGAKSPQEVLPAIGQHFDIIDVRHFAGPLLEMVVDRILDREIGEDMAGSAEMAVIRGIMELDRVLVEGGTVENRYAMIVAEKRPSDPATVH